METYGYVRVSTKEQNTDRQRIAMLNYNVLEENIYEDKISGKDFDRPMYRKLMGVLKEGDCLVVKSIDRLGRDYDDLREQWRIITREKKACIVVLDMPLLNTSNEYGPDDLIRKFVAEIVLEILSFVAENERRNIKERQREGIAAAKLRGVKFGKPVKPVTEGFPDAYRRWIEGETSMRRAAASCEMPFSTFRTKALKIKENK